MTLSLKESLKFVFRTELTNLRIVNSILFLCVVTMMSSCVQSVAVELSGTENKLVLIGEISPDEPIAVNLTSSISVSGEESYDQPTDANIVLSGTGLENSSIAFLYNSDKNKYLLRNPDFRVVEGGTYFIEASIPNTEFNEVTGSTSIPTKSEILQATIEKGENLINEDGSVKYSYDLTIEVPKQNDVTSFMHIVPSFEFMDATILTTTGESVFTPSGFYGSFKIDQVLLGKNAVQVLHNKSGFIIDNSRVADGLLKLRITTNQGIIEGKEGVTQVTIDALNATEEYFRYNSTISRQLDVNNSPFGSPGTTFSNIEGGYGVFAGYSKTTQKFDIN